MSGGKSVGWLWEVLGMTLKSEPGGEGSRSRMRGGHREDWVLGPVVGEEEACLGRKGHECGRKAGAELANLWS